MQNVISSAFETVTTVEGGVELLDIFMHLSSREVMLCYFDPMFSDRQAYANSADPDQTAPRRAV